MLWNWYAFRGVTTFTWSTRLQFLIAGQSNASGRGRVTRIVTPGHKSIFMYGNDYVWKKAYEPVDDPSGQIDSVSDDIANLTDINGHSFALQCAQGLVAADRRIDLIPCAMGGTSMSQWLPGGDRLDRTTLYGSANYRRTQAAVATLTAVLYFGHENQAGEANYATQWSNLVSEFRTDYGASVPFIYCQLAKHTDTTQNGKQHASADVQRRQETGSGDALEMTNMHMITTFDLSLIDSIHLDEIAQRKIGDRMALAIREHVLGESVDGTGPRLNGAPTKPAANKVKVDTTQTLATISGNADNQFRVFDNGVEMTVSSVVNDADTSAVLITMSASASGTVTVSYGNVVASGVATTLNNVVKNAAGLPLPQFAAITAV